MPAKLLDPQLLWVPIGAMPWKRLVTENKIRRGQIRGRLRLNDGKRRTLAEIGKGLGRKAPAEVASIVKPETILGLQVISPEMGQCAAAKGLVGCSSTTIEGPDELIDPTGHA